MKCELDKPQCKRKVMSEKQPFQMKKCPLSVKPRCPLAPPQCPLVQQEGRDCPVAEIVGSKGDKCPLAEPGCPCDPSPPCPLTYLDGDRIYESENSSEDTKWQSSKRGETISNRICDKLKQINATKKRKNEFCGKIKENNEHNYIAAEEGEIAKASEEKEVVMLKKGLTVPDCPLSSRRPLPCTDCLAVLLDCPLAPRERTDPKVVCKFKTRKCPFLQIVDMCDDECLCSEVPQIDVGPRCPFLPQPSPSSAKVRCPLSRVPDCPLVCKTKEQPEQRVSCTCSCPLIPLSCSTNVPECPLHKFPSCPQAKATCTMCCCNRTIQNCPMVPDAYASCPLQETSLTEPCQNLDFGAQSDYNRRLPLAYNQANPNLNAQPTPTIFVPQTMITTLDKTLHDLNEKCTCQTPPPPQLVQLIPLEFDGSEVKTHDMPSLYECDPECPQKPKRTFHVPTCPQNQISFQSIPKSVNRGDMVCPFSPKDCPLGRKCPFPVAAVEEFTPEEMKQYQDQISKTCPCKCNTTCTSKKKEVNRESTSDSNLREKIKPLKGKRRNPRTTRTRCPLDDMSNSEKNVCPYSPLPCPLDPIKPLSIKTPEPCPYAPQPVCPLMPPPLCPATPKCLLQSTPPLPECPNAPPGCPLAPKKVCTPGKKMSRAKDDCPCPKPEQKCPCCKSKPPCSCIKPEPECSCRKPPCPCPVLEPKCPRPKFSGPEPVSKCPNPCPDISSSCFPTDLNCTCPDVDQCCPCPMPELLCPSPPEPCCPCPDTKLQCPCPPPKIDCPLFPKPKYSLTTKKKSKCPFSETSKITSPIKSKNEKEIEDNEKTQTKKELPLELIIDSLRAAPKNLNCPVKSEPCDKFPEGRCRMEDLGLCDCDYPVESCLERPQAEGVEAPPQYCVKKDCCMGLTLPTTVPDPNVNVNGPFYKMTPTHPGRPDTKYKIDILAHPPNPYPLGPPKKRKYPNQYVVKYGKAYEKCKKVAEILKNRPPSLEQASQFDKKDIPMDPETKMVLENRENQKRLNRAEKVI